MLKEEYKHLKLQVARLKNLKVVEKESLVSDEVLVNPEAFKKIDERYHDELGYQSGRMQWLCKIIPIFSSVEDKLKAPLRSKAPESAILKP